MIYALILTVALAVVHIFMKQKPPIWTYPLIYILFFLGLLLSRGTAKGGGAGGNGGHGGTRGGHGGNGGDGNTIRKGILK